MTETIKTIELSDVQLMVSIGVHDFERQKPQKLLVSLSISVNGGEESDNIDKTVDYDQVYLFVKNLEKSGHFDLQETVCRKILDFVLAI
ncbi:MAG: dihydroneopterin aldolase, partial [Rhizobiaceae bacterium]|nr:dihydroneopterin aldolase [Rhizobiaceae bacterium]